MTILDGGLATTLEAAGHDLSGALWSARVLRDDPDAIVQAHRAFVQAGADAVITASYQATLENVGVDVLRSSVTLARQSGARVVAASIGSYGAARADGSEYHGKFDLDESELAAWHEPRVRALEAEAPDWLACETLPSFREARALASIVKRDAWFSFQCRDGQHMADGTPIRESAAFLDDVKRVRMVGVNCTAPQHVDELIAELRRATSKPLIVYPNSGERYHRPEGWSGPTSDWHKRAPEWARQGATFIGGCCRVGPSTIRKLADALR